jgi:cell wall-associated NlpC family hydrolase
VTDATPEGAVSVSRGRLPRYWLAAAVLAAALAALVAVLIANGGSSHGSERARTAAHVRSTASSATARAEAATPAPGDPGAAAGADGGTGGARVNAAEVADPEESKSFPAPASVQHKAAATPAKASAEIVAAGAPSDAEVKQELSQMQAVERTAKQTQQKALTPVKGGESVGGNGTIPIPASAPEVVQRVVAGANAITDFPYVFGGGHASFVDNAYDCSGSVSYALAAGGLLKAPETSGELESWGVAGPGRYITVYAAAGHTYMYVDGILYDTAGRSGTYTSRWQVSPTNNTGYVARHWPGL